RPFCRPKRAVSEARAKLFVGIPQQTFDNLTTVLTNLRAGQVVRRRGLRQLEWGVLHFVQTKCRMLYRQIHLPMAQLRVMLHPVFGTLYRKGTDTDSLTALGQLVLPHRHTPRFDVLVL